MASSDQQTLAICSYNSTGFGLAAQNQIEKLLLCSDILCLQEHFLIDCNDKRYSNTDKLKNLVDSNFDIFIVPATNDTSQISKGRASGGLATIWHKSLTKYVTRKNSQSSRIQATFFNFPNSSTLIINVYFPCDPRSSSSDLTEVIYLLSEIQSIIDQVGPCNVILIGDLNCDFGRNNRFTETVQEYCCNTNIEVFGGSLQTDCIQPVDFTHMSKSGNRTFLSTVDHFVGNKRVIDATSDAGVIHSSLNMSNHSNFY